MLWEAFFNKHEKTRVRFRVPETSTGVFNQYEELPSFLFFFSVFVFNSSPFRHPKHIPINFRNCASQTNEHFFYRDHIVDVWRQILFFLLFQLWIYRHFLCIKHANLLETLGIADIFSYTKHSSSFSQHRIWTFFIHKKCKNLKHRN